MLIPDAEIQGERVTDFECEITSPSELAAIIGELPKDVRIVTDVGASMFSGWGDIKRLEYHSKYNALELFFN